jgi:hypothetical protein
MNRASLSYREVGLRACVEIDAASRVRGEGS